MTPKPVTLVTETSTVSSSGDSASPSAIASGVSRRSEPGACWSEPGTFGVCGSALSSAGAAVAGAAAASLPGSRRGAPVGLGEGSASSPSCSSRSDGGRFEPEQSPPGRSPPKVFTMPTAIRPTRRGVASSGSHPRAAANAFGYAASSSASERAAARRAGVGSSPASSELSGTVGRFGVDRRRTGAASAGPTAGRSWVARFCVTFSFGSAGGPAAAATAGAAAGSISTSICPGCSLRAAPSGVAAAPCSSAALTAAARARLPGDRCALARAARSPARERGASSARGLTCTRGHPAKSRGVVPLGRYTLCTIVPRQVIQCELRHRVVLVTSRTRREGVAPVLSSTRGGGRASYPWTVLGAMGGRRFPPSRVRMAYLAKRGRWRVGNGPESIRVPSSVTKLTMYFEGGGPAPTLGSPGTSIVVPPRRYIWRKSVPNWIVLSKVANPRAQRGAQL